VAGIFFPVTPVRHFLPVDAMWVVWQLLLEFLAALGSDVVFFTMLRRFKVIPV
jgi:hypothetical protein